MSPIKSMGPSGRIAALFQSVGKPDVFLFGSFYLAGTLNDRPLVQLRSIRKAFPGSLVLPTSYTRDGKQGIYLVSSDTDPGQYFHVDHASGQARFVVALSRQLPPALMSPSEPIRLTARPRRLTQHLRRRPRLWTIASHRWRSNR